MYFNASDLGGWLQLQKSINAKKKIFRCSTLFYSIKANSKISMGSILVIVNN